VTRDLRDTPWAGRYGAIYADPPWRFATFDGTPERNPKGPERHYRTDETPTIGRLPVADVAAPDAWLFMWTTFPHLAAGQAHELAALWSDPANPWRGVTGGAWAKRPRGWRGDPDKWQFGPGYLFRSAAEILLVFKRGSPAWVGKSERNLWVAPIREHSRKPDAVREMIVRVTPGVPRLEMFSRSEHPGFDSWGDEAGKLGGKRR
jgi:N6-adenosine-specific RNA methylase IME4